MMLSLLFLCLLLLVQAGLELRRPQTRISAQRQNRAAATSRSNNWV
jgi:hypothetical protein